jgi:hypothetical protein
VYVSAYYHTRALILQCVLIPHTYTGPPSAADDSRHTFVCSMRTHSSSIIYVSWYYYIYIGPPSTVDDSEHTSESPPGAQATDKSVALPAGSVSSVSNIDLVVQGRDYYAAPDTCVEVCTASESRYWFAVSICSLVLIMLVWYCICRPRSPSIRSIYPRVRGVVTVLRCPQLRAQLKEVKI